MAGATTYPDPGGFPLGAPTTSGTTITVDTMLNDPTRVTRRIADITLQRFIATRIFAQGGAVTGGAVVYDQAVLNELYLVRDVEQRAPLGEYPVVTAQRLAPQIATVEDWGGKFPMDITAVRRNDAAMYNNKTTQLGNTIVRKINQRAVDTLNAAVAGMSGSTTFVGHNWNNFQPQGSSATLPASSPAADFAAAQLSADQDELGVTYDLWLVNPAQMWSLRTGYGANLQAMLTDQGIREVYPSNRIAAGTGYAVASGQVGEIRLEQGLQSETWYDPEERTWWTQASVMPVMYVTNPYSIRYVTGLAG